MVQYLLTVYIVVEALAKAGLGLGLEMKRQEFQRFIFTKALAFTSAIIVATAISLYGGFRLTRNFFLGAYKHLYERVCPSVRPSVRPLRLFKNEVLVRTYCALRLFYENRSCTFLHTLLFPLLARFSFFPIP